MILGINGKIGSGKDTLAKIIQYVDACNNCNSSDLPAFDDIEDRDALIYHMSSWENKKFAAKLKEIASIFTGISIESFESQSFKGTNLSEIWDEYDKSFSCGCNNIHDTFIIDGKCANCGESINIRTVPMTCRTFLQRLGTDAITQGLHKNAWINALFADYKRLSHWEDRFYDKENTKLSGHEEVWKYPNWIISDMRFENEMKAIKDRGGLTIRITRPDNPYPQSDHISETALNNAEFDIEVNNIDIDSLFIAAELILERIKESYDK